MSEDNEVNESVKRIAAAQVPTTRVTTFNQRYQLSAVAPTITADRLHGILRAAESGDTQQLFALYRDVILSDAHTQGEFAKRKLAVLGDPMAIVPHDKENDDDVKAGSLVTNLVGNSSGWIKACSHLLDSTLWPSALLEKVFRPSTMKGVKYEIGELVPVPYDLLDYTSGVMMIRDTDAEGRILATKHEPDPNRYIIHRGHLLTTADNWGGPMRSILFWWLLSAMDRDWWGRFLERYGAPFMVGKYDAADDASRTTLERAFALSTRIGGLVVTNETEIEIMQALAASSGEAFEKFHSICNREKSKLIVGQTLSSEAQSTGLGSGVATGQENVREDIRQFDGKMLGETLKDQLFDQLVKINGGIGRAPRAVWGAESAKQAAATGDLLAKISAAGIEPTDEALPTLSERVGFPLQRKAPVPQIPFAGMMPLSAALPPALKANDEIARAGKAELARAFRGSLAPVRQMILASTSPADLEGKIRAFYPDWHPERVAALISDALTAFSANGAAS